MEELMDNSSTCNRLTASSCVGSIDKHRWLPIAFLAAISYSVLAVLNSSLADEVSAAELAFLRGSCSSLVMLVIIIRKGSSLAISDRAEFLLLLCKSALTAVTFYCQTYAYTHMATADATAIMYSYVALTGVMCRIFLKEPFGPFEMFMVCISFVGILLTARPPFLFQYVGGAVSESQEMLAPMLALSATISMSIQPLATRLLSRKNVSVTNITFYTMLCSAAIIVIPTTLFRQWSIPCCPWVLARMFFFVVAGLIANYSLNYAYAIQNGLYVTLITLNDTWIVLLLTVVFVGYKPAWTSLVGTFLIIGSAVAIILWKVVAVGGSDDDNAGRIEDSEQHLADQCDGLLPSEVGPKRSPGEEAEIKPP